MIASKGAVARNEYIKKRKEEHDKKEREREIRREERKKLRSMININESIDQSLEIDNNIQNSNISIPFNNPLSLANNNNINMNDNLNNNINNNINNIMNNIINNNESISNDDHTNPSILQNNIKSIDKELSIIDSITESDDSDKLLLFDIKETKGIKKYILQLANICRRIVQSNGLSTIVMMCIMMATLSIGLQTYDSLSNDTTLNNIDYIILSVFCFECILKILCEGIKPWLYFTGKEWKWNLFDFIIIILCLPVWGSALGSGNVAILRMLRLMRVMKLVKRVPQLYMIVMGLIGGIKSIGYILLLLLLVFYLYAISGMYAWSVNDPFHFRSVFISMITLFRMATLENWSTIFYINYFGCDVYNGGYYSQDPLDAKRYLYCNTTAIFGNATIKEINNTRLMNKFIGIFYFISFIVISALVMLSLFIGAITMSMTASMEQMKSAQVESEKKKRMEKARRRIIENEKRKKELEKDKDDESKKTNFVLNQSNGLSLAEKRDRDKMRDVLLQAWDDIDLTNIITANQGNTKSLKGMYLMIATTCSNIVEHPKFSLFITFVIILAGIQVGIQTDDTITKTSGTILYDIDVGILIVFTSEVILKIISEGTSPQLYFRSGWNTFDFFIVIGSFLKGSGGMLTMLRLLRLLRVLKLVKSFPQLQVIVSALLKGISSIGFIGLILLLCFYIFGIIGNMLFSDNDPYHFKDLHFAMLSLFQCATMDGWSDVMYINYYGCDNYGYDDFKNAGYICKNKPTGILAVIYFVIFIVIGAMVLITLFIGVVTTSMEEATQEMNDEKALIGRIEKLRIQENVDEKSIKSYMQVFSLLDVDNSGSVEEAELRIGLSTIGKYPTYDELREMMAQVDEDGSGQIDIAEFVEFMINLRKKASLLRSKSKKNIIKSIRSENENQKNNNIHQGLNQEINNNNNISNIHLNQLNNNNNNNNNNNIQIIDETNAIQEIDLDKIHHNNKYNNNDNNNNSNNNNNNINNNNINNNNINTNNTIINSSIINNNIEEVILNSIHTQHTLFRQNSGSKSSKIMPSG